MANYDQNRGYQPFDDDRDLEMNRMRHRREDEYNRENYGSYGNAGFENDYMRGRRGENYGNMNRGQGSFYDEKNWRRENEGQGYGNMGNRGYGNRGGMGNQQYGEVYHGNVEEREWETNQARGGRYANRGMSGDDYSRGDYNRGYSNDYGMGYYGGYQGSGYQDTGRRRGDRDWWDRTKDEVKSWTGDDDAERRREMDKRMAGQHRGKGPRGYSRSQDRIREDVCERLSDDSYVDASDIDIQVEGTDVILSGTVNSREEKRRAEDLAESISGVHNVENRLKVNPRASDYGYDSDDRYGRADRRRSDFGDKYTGTTDDVGGIGRASGTTNEVIRDVSGKQNLK